MSEKKQNVLKGLVNAAKPLSNTGIEKLTTLAEGMAIQKSLATNEKKGDEKKS